MKVTAPGFNAAGVPYYVVDLESQNETVRDRMAVKKLVGWNELLPLPFLHNHFSMICLIWNCRGAGNSVFKRTMKDMLRTHNPDFLVLVETKVPLSTLNDFFKNKGFTASSCSDPVGRSGGIWVLWDPSRVNVSAVEVTNQVIHATIARADFEEWVFSAVYGSTNPAARDLMWYDLQQRAANDNRKWFLAGDFNDHAASSEKRCFQRGNSYHRCNKFSNFLNSCNFIDLGCVGPKLTWSNNRAGLANTMVRLDRAICNSRWQLAFPNVVVKNLPRVYSDHCPFIVFTEGSLTPITSPVCSVSRTCGLATLTLLESFLIRGILLISLSWKNLAF